MLDNHLKILTNDQKGKPVFLWFAKPNELVGLTTYFQNDRKYTCTAIAGDMPCKVIFIPNHHFTKLLKAYPAIKHQLLKILCDRITFMEKRTKNMLHQSIDERIIETLLFLAAKENHQAPDHKPSGLRINFSTKELAEMVGASLEYLRRRIKHLKNTGLIDYGRNWLTIRDMNRLRLMTQH